MHAKAQMTGDVQTAGTAEVKSTDPASDSAKTKISCPYHMQATDKTDAQTQDVAPAATQVETGEQGVAPVSSKPDAQSAEVISAEKLPEICPDVSGKSELMNFHKTMHPMHMAFNDGKYDEMRALFPKLDEASKGLASYKCPMGDKCPPDCKKNFEISKAALLRSVANLRETMKGTDNKKLGDSYMTMHEAYVKFGSLCQPAKETTTKEVKSTK
jgi:hypothetical protein